MKFRTKVTICMVWLLALTYGVGGTLLVSSSFRAALNKEKERAKTSSQLILNTISVVGSYANVSDTLRQLSSHGRTDWAGLQVLSGSDVIFSSGEAIDADAMADSTLRVSGDRLLLSSPVGDAPSELSLRATFDISSVYAQRDAQLRIYRVAFFFVVVIGTGLSWVLSTLLTRPLHSLARVSREMAAGNLSSRVHSTSQDELGQLSREFNQMADKLQESMDGMRDAMERQDEFMGSFAHELKTPMTSIIGYADLLRSQELSEQDRREAANYVFSEGKRLETLSLKLLDLLVLEKEDLPLQPVSPKALIEDMAREFRPILEPKQIELSCRCQEGTCNLEPDLFKSLLYNLMDNARKAMDETGGRVLIQSEMTEDGCRIRVADNGRGMPQAALDKITEAFYRVDKSRSRAQGGAGLGLALCRRIVELHRGDIQFASREGVGTCVTLCLRGGRP